MERRTFISLLVGTPTIAALAACGSDQSANAPVTDSDTLPPTTDPAPTTTPDTDTPTPVNDASAVLEFGYYGGFSTAKVAFDKLASVYVTSNGTDGRVFTPAPAVAMFPGPLVVGYNMATITSTGLDDLLSAADSAGMLAVVEYERNQQIADAATATLRITTDEATYDHEAYALDDGGLPGSAEQPTPQRQALADFVRDIEDVATLVGTDELGTEELFEPTGYHVVATPAGDLDGYDVEPTVMPWPADTGIVLADTTECTAVDRQTVGDLFVDATELTFFTEGDVTYQVLARAALPGRDC